MSPSKRTNEEVAREFVTAPRFISGGGDGLSLTLEIWLVTVLYGGGAVAGYPDEITPFRPSSIRGHLRFWWRATRGAEYTSYQALREREAQIWGDTDRQSPVRIRVECPDAMKPRRFALRRYERDVNRRYALFPPFEDKRKDLDSNRLQEGGGFYLTLSMPSSAKDLREDIDAALWGWVNFGGLGARTRRGAGALYCQQYAGWDGGKVSGDGALREWPVLKGGTLIWGSRPLPWQDCWSELLRFYREFRQDRGVGGRGKTQWPEPEEIRAIRQRQEPPGVEGFPRGALGLPIVFHFKDREDPKDQILNIEQPESRRASPVILRPFAISREQALPFILVLNTNARSLYLHEGKSRPIPVPAGRRLAIQELIRKAQERWKASVTRI